MITIYEYGPTRSSRCLWALQEADAPFERVQVDLAAGAHRDPGFLALNPMGRVPVVVEGEFVLTESLAICNWIADRHPESGLIPRPGTPERGQHDQWMFFCATELDAPLWRIRRNTVLLPESERVPGDVARAKADFTEAASVLESSLGRRRFLVNGHFTVADIAMTHTLFWATWSDLIEGHPMLQRYMDEHRRRPACPDVLRNQGPRSTPRSLACGS